jgi:hypothetical protein
MLVHAVLSPQHQRRRCEAGAHQVVRRLLRRQRAGACAALLLRVHLHHRCALRAAAVKGWSPIAASCRAFLLLLLLLQANCAVVLFRSCVLCTTLSCVLYG